METCGACIPPVNKITRRGYALKAIGSLVAAEVDGRWVRVPTLTSKHTNTLFNEPSSHITVN